MLGYFRLLAATGVLLAHTSNFVSESTSRAMVTAFFVVSGYLISMTITENYPRNPMAFYRNRFLRLYPIYWVVAGVTALTYAPWFYRHFADMPAGDQAARWLGVLALTFHGAPLLVAPAWSLPYEITFYLVAPLVIAAGRLGVGLLIGVGVVGFGLRQEVAVLLHPFGIGVEGLADAILASLPIFGLGCVLYLARVRVSAQAGRILQVAGLAGLGAVLLMGSRYVSPDGAAYDAASNAWIALATYAATAAVLLGWDRKESAASKLSGDLTYPLYLVHWPLLNSALFASDAVRSISDSAGHLLPLGHIVSIAIMALVGSLALSYGLVLLERRFVAPMRAGRAPASRLNPVYSHSR